MRRAKDGAPLLALVQMLIPLCQQAERAMTGVRCGAKPVFKDWQMAVLIMIAILKKKKSKSAQYRFLWQHRRELSECLRLNGFPVRSTYCRRYARIFPLFQAAMKQQTSIAEREGLLDPRRASADKSVIEARGPAWRVVQQRRNERPAGVDAEATWAYSRHHGWQFGFAYEAVVSRTKDGSVWPLVASVETASVKETKMFLEKVPSLPPTTRSIAADKGYDSNAVAEAVEWDARGRRTGRRFLCPQIYRRGQHRQGNGPRLEHGQRAIHRQRRQERLKFLQSAAGRRLYQARSRTIEPFHDWFKQRFELDKHCWHRGINNNRTQILAAMTAYQLLIRFNHRHHRPNGQIAWILDGL